MQSAACFLAASATSVRDKLSTFLQASAVKIYRSTLRYGPLDADAEMRFIERLDYSLDFPQSDTVKQTEYCQRFVAVVGPRQMRWNGPACRRRESSLGHTSKIDVHLRYSFLQLKERKQ
jgi:hypothetical protein